MRKRYSNRTQIHPSENLLLQVKTSKTFNSEIPISSPKTQSSCESDAPTKDINAGDLVFNSERQMQDLEDQIKIVYQDQSIDPQSRYENNSKDTDIQLDSNKFKYDEDVENKNNSKESQFKIDKKRSFNRSQTLSKRKSFVSTVEEEQYFMQDSRDCKGPQEFSIEQVKHKKNYFITFRPSLFFEFYLYHFLFCCVLGPLSVPIIMLFNNRNTILVRNLQFWGNYPGTKSQTLVYVMSFFSIFIYYYIQSENMFFYGEMVIIIVTMMIRILSIAVKYATYDQYQIYTLKHQLLTDEQISSEILLQHWFSQIPKVQYTEIHFQLRRHEIDESMFYIQFMVAQCPEQFKIIQDNIKQLEEFHEKQNFQPQILGGEQNQDSENQFIYGYGILKELIDNHQQQTSGKRKLIILISILYGLFRSSSPFIVRWYIGRPVFGKDGWETAAMFITLLSNFMAVVPIFLIIIAGIIDIQRKNFLMEQFTFMLSPRRLQNINGKKIMPSINFFSSLSIKGWMILRKVAFDYGSKFFLRQQGNLSLALFFCLISIPVQVLSIFKVIKVDQAFSYILFLDLISLSVLVVFYLAQGGQLNETFQQHIQIMRENKAIIDDLYRNRKYYFQGDFKSNNFLYAKAIQYFNSHIQTDIECMDKDVNISNYKAIKQNMKDLQQVYTEFIEELQNDEQVYPMKMFGITIKSTMLSSIGVGLLSAIGTISASYYNQL